MTEELLLQADELLAYFARFAHKDGYKLAKDATRVIKALADELREKEWQPIEEIHGKEGRAWLLNKDYHLPEHRYKDCSIEEFQYGEQPEYPYGVGWFTMDWQFMMKEKEYSHFLIVPQPLKEKQPCTMTAP